MSAARLHAIAALRKEKKNVRMRRHALAALLATATALYKVDIHIAGRAPSPKSWEAAAVDEYAKRLRGTIDVKTIWHKSGEALEKSIAKMEAVLCLSPEGKRVDSEGFSTLLYDALDKGGSRLCPVSYTHLTLPTTPYV